MLTNCPKCHSELRESQGYYSCKEHGLLVYKKCAWTECKQNIWAFQTWASSIDENSVLYCREHVKLVNDKAFERRIEQLRREARLKTRSEISEIHGLNDLNRQIRKLEKDNPPIAALLKKARAKREQDFFGDVEE